VGDWSLTFEHDREAYTDAKTPFVERILKIALAEKH